MENINYQEHSRQAAIPKGNSQHRPKVSVQDIFLATTWEQFTLPTDGRKRKHLAEQRRTVVLYMSGFKSFYMGRIRTARELGMSVATCQRRLTELGPDKSGPDLIY